MIAIFGQAALTVIGLLILWLMFEPFLARAVRRAGKYLPDDICGPDGWLHDTSNSAGIFDLPSRRRQG